MKIEQLLLLEMKLANIIKDDDNMDWTSPDNQFMFTIKRYDTTFGIDNPFVLNMNVLTLTFAFALHINIASIIGMAIAIFLYRKAF